MRAPMKVFLISAVMVMASISLVAAQSITVDHVDGLNTDGTIPAGGNLTFHMRVTGDATAHMVMSNGFRFYSNDLTWGGAAATLNPAYAWDLNYGFPCMFDLGFFINYFSNDGMGADTVGFGGAAGMYGTGLPAGFDDIGWTIDVGPVEGPGTKVLTLDSAYYPPAGYWLWDIVEENVAWGGPYEYVMEGGAPEPYTYCTPQPTVLKEITRILDIHIANEDPATVDFSTVVVQGNIPSYTGVRVEGNEIVTDVFVFRFLGASGFRPITGDFEATYTVEYMTSDEGLVVLTGDFALQVYPGDVTIDGEVNQEDIVFLVDYLWNGGQMSELEEFTDVDGNGRVDVMDLRELVQIVY